MVTPGTPVLGDMDAQGMQVLGHMNTRGTLFSKHGLQKPDIFRGYIFLLGLQHYTMDCSSQGTQYSVQSDITSLTGDQTL